VFLQVRLLFLPGSRGSDPGMQKVSGKALYIAKNIFARAAYFALSFSP
jgi:hypothetical protein